MAYTSHPEAARETSSTAFHLMTALGAVIGVVAAVIGAWMAYWADAGTITLFNWTWNVADLTEGWAPFLMIAGGALTTLSMGTESIRDWTRDVSRWLLSLELLVSVVGIAAIVFGFIVLF